MASPRELRLHARPERTMGRVSRYAQQRVDERVIEIMSRRDASAQGDPPSHRVPPQRFQRRSAT